ncbi:MAG TPA: RidA family protein, partial [Candidatus Dormibacteraeota bacterium]
MPAPNRHLAAPPGLAPGPGYSHVVTGSGRLVYVSGQVALDEQGNLVGGADIAAQTEQVFSNLRRALEAAGASFDQVVKLNYYLADIGGLAAVRGVRDRYLGAERPASTLVE